MSRRNRYKLMEPEVSCVKDPASHPGSLSFLQALKEKHHRSGTMIGRDSSHLRKEWILKMDKSDKSTFRWYPDPETPS